MQTLYKTLGEKKKNRRKTKETLEKDEQISKVLKNKQNEKYT